MKNKYKELKDNERIKYHNILISKPSRVNDAIEIILWKKQAELKGRQDKEKELKFNLSKKIQGVWDDIDNGLIRVENVKEFINRRITDLELEQKQAKGNDWKRSLLLLKANLEKDAGDKLIEEKNNDK